MQRAVALAARTTTSRLGRLGFSGHAKRVVKDVHPATRFRCIQPFSTTFGKYYHIEASNAERPDATKLTVRGPDVDGILASMTVALAVKGCSLVELHAAMAMDCSHDHVVEDKHLIKDVFFVVNRQTGQPFPDEELRDLAESLLEAAKSPMKAVSMKGVNSEVENLEAHLKEHVPVPETQITVIPRTKNK